MGNDKRRKFVQEYVKDYNATQAAIRAGYSPRTARSQGQRLLTFVDIQEMIPIEENRILAEEGVSASHTLREIARIAYSDMQTYMAWSDQGSRLVSSTELPPGASATVQEVTHRVARDGSSQVKIKLYSKLDALEKLARHYELYKDSSTPIDADLYRRIQDDASAKVVSQLGDLARRHEDDRTHDDDNTLPSDAKS